MKNFPTHKTMDEYHIETSEVRRNQLGFRAKDEDFSNKIHLLSQSARPLVGEEKLLSTESVTSKNIAIERLNVTGDLGDSAKRSSETKLQTQWGRNAHRTGRMSFQYYSFRAPTSTLLSPDTEIEKFLQSQKMKNSWSEGQINVETDANITDLSLPSGLNNASELDDETKNLIYNTVKFAGVDESVSKENMNENIISFNTDDQYFANGSNQVDECSERSIVNFCPVTISSEVTNQDQTSCDVIDKQSKESIKSIPSEFEMHIETQNVNERTGTYTHSAELQGINKHIDHFEDTWRKYSNTTDDDSDANTVYEHPPKQNEAHPNRRFHTLQNKLDLNQYDLNYYRCRSQSVPLTNWQSIDCTNSLHNRSRYYSDMQTDDFTTNSSYDTKGGENDPQCLEDLESFSQEDLIEPLLGSKERKDAQQSVLDKLVDLLKDKDVKSDLDMYYKKQDVNGSFRNDDNNLPMNEDKTTSTPNGRDESLGEYSPFKTGNPTSSRRRQRISPDVSESSDKSHFEFSQDSGIVLYWRDRPRPRLKHSEQLQTNLRISRSILVLMITCCCIVPPFGVPALIFFLKSRSSFDPDRARKLQLVSDICLICSMLLVLVLTMGMSLPFAIRYESHGTMTNHSLRPPLTDMNNVVDYNQLSISHAQSEEESINWYIKRRGDGTTSHNTVSNRELESLNSPRERFPQEQSASPKPQLQFISLEKLIRPTHDPIAPIISTNSGRNPTQPGFILEPSCNNRGQCGLRPVYQTTQRRTTHAVAFDRFLAGLDMPTRDTDSINKEHSIGYPDRVFNELVIPNYVSSETPKSKESVLAPSEVDEYRSTIQILSNSKLRGMQTDVGTLITKPFQISPTQAPTRKESSTSRSILHLDKQ